MPKKQTPTKRAAKPVPPPVSELGAINHIVVVMLENRSFDHMLGYLYSDAGNVSPLGNPFDGLTGSESNPDGKGGSVKVFKIQSSDPHALFLPRRRSWRRLSEYERSHPQDVTIWRFTNPATSATSALSAVDSTWCRLENSAGGRSDASSFRPYSQY
jgi:phospholipase C